MQACMVCMYVCVRIGVHCRQDGVSRACLSIYTFDTSPELFVCLSIYENAETLSPHCEVGTGWKPHIWVCRMETPRMGLSRVILLPSWDQGDLSNRSPICRGVHVYEFTHVHTWVHLYAWVWVWTEWRYMDIEGLKGGKRAQDRNSEMDVCT